MKSLLIGLSQPISKRTEGDCHPSFILIVSSWYGNGVFDSFL